MHMACRVIGSSLYDLIERPIKFKIKYSQRKEGEQVDHKQQDITNILNCNGMAGGSTSGCSGSGKCMEKTAGHRWS